MSKHKWVVWWKTNGFASHQTLSYDTEFQETETFNNFFSALMFFINKKLNYIGIIEDVEDFKIKLIRI